MKALVLREDATATAKSATALIDKGFQVACVETRKVARALIQLDTIDLLVMDEQVNGQLTHALALSAERRNPYVSAIMFTDRTGPDTDELYDLIPCLYGLVGSDSSGQLIGQLALSSTENFAEAQARVDRLAQWAGPDDTHLDDATLDALLAAEDAALCDADGYDDGVAEPDMAVAQTALPTECDIAVAMALATPVDEPQPINHDGTIACDPEQVQPAADADEQPDTTGPLILTDFDAVKFASFTAAHSYMRAGPDVGAKPASARFAAAS